MVLLLALLGLALQKEQIVNGESAQEDNQKVIDFLNAKRDKMETFLEEMGHSKHISENEKRLFKEIKDYVVLLGQQRENIKKSGNTRQLEYVDRDLKTLVGRIDDIEAKNNLCACRGQKDCECDLNNQLPEDILMGNLQQNLRLKGKKMLRKRQDVVESVKDEMDNNKEEIMGRMKNSQTNVNTTMNQLATAGVDGDMKALAEALKK